MRNSMIVSAAVIALMSATAAGEGNADAAAGAQSARPAPQMFQLEINPKEMPNLKPAPVREVQLPGVLETTGLVTFDDRRIATISSRVQGRIEDVKASVWDTVTKGQPILELYSPDFMTAEAEYIQARNMRAASQGLSDISSWMMDAAKRKLELLGMQDDDIVALSTPSTTITMRAPISGTILQNQAVRGSAVNSGDVLYQVGTLDKVWITADIYEVDLGRVAVGQELAAVTTAFPKEVFHGKIARVSPAIDPNSHTAQIKCEVDNPGLKLKPQMLARVRILTQANAAIVVPQQSLVFDGDSYYAFVPTGSNKVERRKVEISTWNEEGYARVVSGLKSGERVMPEALRLNALWHQSRGESY